MDKLAKYAPYILLIIAVISVYLQWKTYQKQRQDCGCKDAAGNDLGPIIE